MRKIMAGLALLGFTAGISAETVISYDDGSTYTLTDGQEIYISSQTLFKRRILNNKDTFFTAQDPWTSRDYVPEPQDHKDLLVEEVDSERALHDVIM